MGVRDRIPPTRRTGLSGAAHGGPTPTWSTGTAHSGPVATWSTRGTWSGPTMPRSGA